MLNRLVGAIARRIRRPVFREAGFRTLTLELAEEGEVQLAEWLHGDTAAYAITQEKVNLYKHFTRNGETVLDIGAHEGDTTAPMAMPAGRDGVVLAVDPNPFVFKVLAENARLNPTKTHIIPLNFVYTGPITLTQYQRLQNVRDRLEKEGISIPLPTGN